MPVTTAAQNGVRYLHHYQRFSGDWPGYLEQTLRDRVIYMPSPSRFNDPWDCQPWFDLDALDRPSVRDEHIAWFLARANSPQPGDAEEMRTRPGLLKEMVTQCSHGLAEQIDAEYRVYCLTPSDGNLLMWSHYAENHTGVCLQFDARAEPFVGAFKVSYRRVLPTSTLPEYGNEAMVKALLTKSDVWIYEHEFRIVAKDQRAPSEGVPTAINGLVRIAETALVRVTVGCQCTEADQIVEMVQRYQPRVSVRQANRHPHRYGIGYTTLHEGQ
jgi:hypothetical protein